MIDTTRCPGHQDNHDRFLNRRDAFQHTKQQLHSFRITPKETTAQLLSDYTRVAPVDESLEIRRRSLTCQKEKLHSFRLPKETTAKILHDSMGSLDSFDDQQELPLPRRNLLQRFHKKPKMTSFRIPKDQLHNVLTMQPVSDEEEDNETEEQQPPRRIQRRRGSLLAATLAENLERRAAKEIPANDGEHPQERLTSSPKNDNAGRFRMPHQLLRQSSVTAMTA